MIGLFGAIILLIIGIVLYAFSRQMPPGVSVAAYWIGIILALIGLILLVIAVLGVAGLQFIIPF